MPDLCDKSHSIGGGVPVTWPAISDGRWNAQSDCRTRFRAARDPQLSLQLLRTLAHTHQPPVQSSSVLQRKGVDTATVIHNRQLEAQPSPGNRHLYVPCTGVTYSIENCLLRDGGDLFERFSLQAARPS